MLRSCGCSPGSNTPVSTQGYPARFCLMTDSGHRYSCLVPVRDFLSHKAFLIGHDRSFWLPDSIYTSPQNICCSASLHRVLSYVLFKVVEVSTRGCRGSVTTDGWRKTNIWNSRQCVYTIDIKGTWRMLFLITGRTHDRKDCERFATIFVLLALLFGNVDGFFYTWCCCYTNVDVFGLQYQ